MVITLVKPELWLQELNCLKLFLVPKQGMLFQVFGRAEINIFVGPKYGQDIHLNRI